MVWGRRQEKGTERKRRMLRETWGRIGLNVHRIVRFPNKLGARALLKSVVKGAMKERGQEGQEGRVGNKLLPDHSCLPPLLRDIGFKRMIFAMQGQRNAFSCLNAISLSYKAK
eukprot:Plantae.Rhodophyta-Hildenbrandia_rubra.ctg11862.p1 GENE.Plantae.Rhodophyta-Hildenbrandia_rubra.ctg11862~~Plantae.Rhodophyta-Hildenbrandia_rubra.ctg11862.p1  ORF type:complete len:113 (-),score=16.91 Plantae.Rhodophyta-Hildenbrandia_rubra.ctg11862:1258-1596(-)